MVQDVDANGDVDVRTLERELMELADRKPNAGDLGGARSCQVDLLRREIATPDLCERKVAGRKLQGEITAAAAGIEQPAHGGLSQHSVVENSFDDMTHAPLPNGKAWRPTRLRVVIARSLQRDRAKQ